MSTETLTPFHLAIQVRDIIEAREFYLGVVGCTEGRSAAQWVDFNLFGHQLVCHLNPAIGREGKLTLMTSDVDEHAVPVPHFGVVLRMDEWSVLATRLTAAGVSFVVEPHVRFEGQPGEQATLFFLDPTGNALEFKAFRDIEKQLFEV